MKIMVTYAQLAPIEEPRSRRDPLGFMRSRVTTRTVSGRELDARSFDDKLTSFANAVRSGMATA